MGQLQRVFDCDGQQVRTTIIDGQVWFAGKDVCDYFGDTNHHRSLARLDDDEKGVSQMDTPGGPQSMIVINEAGLYSLLFAMQPQKANVSEEWYQERIGQIKRFKRWVTHDVLPSIRRHGLYATDEVVDRILADPDFGIQLLTSYKEERERRLQAERTNAILMHVTKTYTATEIAKELGFRSATALNRDLADKRIQYKQNETWVLYSDYASRGYVEIKQEVLDSGKVIYHRRWTQLGREFLLNLYAEEASA